MRTAAICPTCATYTNALCTLYNGPYLSCIGVSPLDSLETALVLIDGAVCLNNAQIATINSQIVTINGQITTIQGNITTIDGQITTINNTLANMSLQAVTTIGNTTNLGINLTATVANPVSGVTLGGTNNQFSIIGLTYTGSFDISGLTANRVITVPNATGTMALTSDITLQNATAGANKNLIDSVNLQGTGAGGGTFSGININAFGASAAYDNSGSDVNALGNNVAYSNTGDNINAFGVATAQSNSGNDVNAIGSNAANGNSGSGINALGGSAAEQNQGDNINAIGSEAAENNVGNMVDAMGYKAAKDNSGDDVIALGNESAFLNGGSDVVAIGRSAANNNTLSGMFIISNNCLPSYADHAAAIAAINIGTAVTGNTYIYHDQATNSIGAVRL